MLLYPRYEVYRGYIVFAFSVIMFICLSVNFFEIFMGIVQCCYTPGTKYIGGI